METSLPLLISSQEVRIALHSWNFYSLAELEDGDASDDEDDLEIGGVTQVYTCPISLTPLVKPMTT